MATTTSITSTYAGEAAKEYIAAALLSANTIDNGGISVKPNIKYKQVIKKLATGDLVANGSCDFAATSSVTLTERIIEPETFQVNLQLCKADFRSDWDAIEMGFSAFDTLPSTFQDFLIAHVAEKVAQKIESNIWTGVNANAGEFDGFLTLLLNDADVVDITASAITASNVVTEMQKVVDAIPAAVYGKEDLYLYASQNVVKAYIAALGGFGASGLGANGFEGKGPNQGFAAGLEFGGIKVFPLSSFGSNKIVAAQKSNLYFGTGLLNDTNEVKVIDMADVDGSQNVRVVMRFTASVQFGIGSEIVLYS